MNWFELGSIETIPKQGSRVVKTVIGDLAVFRTVNDDVFALLDCCYHQGGPLSQGVVFGDQVACPLHNRVTELDTGHAAPPDIGHTCRYETKIIDGRVFIELPEDSMQSETISAAS